jgi:serine/threonine protein phosphatase PrpC
MIEKVAHFIFPGRGKENQDSFLIFNKEGLTVLAVADGMGGHSAGDIASKICVEVVEEYFDNNPCIVLNEDVISKCYERVVSRLASYASENPEKENLGSTLTLAIISGEQLFIAHVGDTRLYLLRGNGLKSLTKDQTEVQHLIDQKIINSTQAKHYKRKNVLLSVLNAKGSYNLQVAFHDIAVKDRIVLMTDGCYANISKVELRDISIDSDSVEKWANTVKKVVENNGIKDDYTGVFYEHC